MGLALPFLGWDRSPSLQGALGFELGESGSAFVYDRRMEKILFGLGFWGIAVFALSANHGTKKIKAEPDQKALATVGPLVIFMMVFLGAILIASAILEFQRGT